MLDFYVDPRGVTMFSKTTCPYCIKAKQLLNEYQVGLQTYELDNISNRQLVANNLKRQTGRSTVPNIFVYGKNIGGYEELKRMADSGELLSVIKSHTNTPIDYDYFNNGFNEWGAPI
jgi:glutaredoxin 3